MKLLKTPKFWGELKPLLAAGICIGAMLCASADEPVWPSDFDAQLAANRVAALPGAGQSATSDGAIASAVRKWYAAFSDFVSLNTKKIKGIVLDFK